MTRGELNAKWDRMSPRERDALVGAHVMGLDIVDGTLPQLPKHYLPEYERTIFTDVPLFTSEISAAWRVLEKMKPLIRWYGVEQFGLNVRAVFRLGRTDINLDWFEAVAPTAPEAICKAASLAVLKEVTT